MGLGSSMKDTLFRDGMSKALNCVLFKSIKNNFPNIGFRDHLVSACQLFLIHILKDFKEIVNLEHDLRCDMAYFRPTYRCSILWSNRYPKLYISGMLLKVHFKEDHIRQKLAIFYYLYFLYKLGGVGKTYQITNPIHPRSVSCCRELWGLITKISLEINRKFNKQNVLECSARKGT